MTVLLATLFWLPAPPAAAQEASRLEFKSNGFSIDSLEGASDQATTTVLSMMLPPTEGFAPNVNVQLQPYKGTIDEYAEISRKQFVAVGAKVLRDEETGAAVVWDYVATIGGKKLHIYSRAEKAGVKVYLATGTALESQWASVGERLKSCVDSMQMDPTPAARE